MKHEGGGGWGLDMLVHAMLVHAMLCQAMPCYGYTLWQGPCLGSRKKWQLIPQCSTPSFSCTGNLTHLQTSQTTKLCGESRCACHESPQIKIALAPIALPLDKHCHSLVCSQWCWFAPSQPHVVLVEPHTGTFLHFLPHHHGLYLQHRDGLHWDCG